ncbi:MAG: ABC transporter substrate-binding protein [Streptosporangiaceae bacterium]
MNLGPTVVLHAGSSGECVGVTDGAFHFQFGSQQQDSALANVERAIMNEDKEVTASKIGYVSVVYLMPAAAAGNAESVPTFINQLEGAYTAQMAANGPDNLGADVGNSGQTPLIQVLIASSGLQAAEYQVTEHIILSDITSQRVVAVDGIAISLQGTVREATELAVADHIPIFGSTLTADEFDNIPNMVRVAPSNEQEVEQILAYVKAKLKSRSALIVEDTNPTDPYTQTISAEFAAAFPDRAHQLLPPQTYDTDPTVDPTGQITRGQLSQIPLDICASKPDVVLFGGRGEDLATLIGDLAHRPCSQPVTIVTGDDVINVQVAGNAPVLAGLASGVTVYYPGEFNPGEWSTPPGTNAPEVLVAGQNVYSQAQAGYSAFAGEFSALFPRAAAPDANVALAYDAMLTSVADIRLANSGIAPAPSAVAQELNKLQGPRTVYGASGPVQLSGFYGQIGKAQPQGSNPIGKLIPILSLPKGGVTSFKALEQVPLPANGG